jgi:hypothetical protein
MRRDDFLRGLGFGLLFSIPFWIGLWWAMKR